MIEARGLEHRYARSGGPVLRGIDLTIREGEYVAVIGPNGCGKTTLVRHFNGLLLPDRGDVLVDGMNTRERKELGRIRQRVGMVFGNPDDQLIGMTVEEDISFGPGNMGVAPPEIRRRVDVSLDVVRMSRYAKSPPHLLSEGEKQLVAIAGILAMEPKYIVLDEPTAYLDPASRKRVIEMILALHRKGITIIHVTHHPEDLFHAERVVVLHGGVIAGDDSPARFLGSPETLTEIGLGIPGITELLSRLKERGLSVNPAVRTIDDACMEILQLLQGSEHGERGRRSARTDAEQEGSAEIRMSSKIK
jgi:biotin transport system ATP-binding protein/energy-coupling factor transport system ATP-binding protein